MALQITITRSPDGVTLQESSMVFPEQGGGLGRGDGNHWVLLDPDRFLSSNHCEIRADGGQYFLIDLSTNGTFVNGSPEPIGKGGRIALNDGDTFELGDYQFSFSNASSSGTDEMSPFSSASSPFAGMDEFAPQQSSQLKDVFGRSNDGIAPLPLNSEPQETDPLAALDKASSSAGMGDQELFGCSDPFENGIDASHYDGADAINQAVHWPDASPSNAIPEGWDDDLMAPVQPAPAPTQQIATPSRPSRPLPSAPAPGNKSVPLTDPPVSRASQKPAPQPAGQKRGADTGRAAEIKAAKIKAAKARVAAAKKESSAANASLVDAMGLAEQSLTDEQKNDIAKTVGELLPEIIEGMMQILRSRASIKNEFRMNITTIQPVENNPLKFSVSAQEAIENMFVRNSSAYKKPRDAFRDGFSGIAEHQVAIIAGIRAAFKNMMERFNPEILENQFDKSQKGVLLPGMQKARYWSSYTDYYSDFVDNMEQSFQFLFGDEFVQAYEDQLRRLAATRNRSVKNDD
ncbi:type VI secretion system-associated FHA domain protein TagH [Teredinibacter haidensis]|uniref:type VI secretion system-associated FHA domain protein TagH n=1 Tax=Teredinibacter haidensis TaxID=2731755 RepID=UPI0009489BED|nr:type VI secretion system-associated FHA domain protein TagH [Teredinibacter haidensis]